MKWTRKVEKNEKAFLRRAHKRKDLRIAAALAAGFFGWGAASQAVFAEITLPDASKYADTIKKDGNVYDIENQLIRKDGKMALNFFDQFSLSQNEIANLHLGTVETQINRVAQKVDIQGIVNALKENGEIGGNVFFLSAKGILVGETGRINAGNLYLGTNESRVQSTIWDNVKDLSSMSMKDKLVMLGNEEGAGIEIRGKLQAAGEVLIGAHDGITVAEKASIVSGVDFAKNTEHKSAKPDANWTADDYREKFMNMDGVEDAKTVVETKDGGIGLYSEGTLTFNGTAATHGGKLTMDATAKELKVEGTAEKNATLVSHGGDIRLTVTSDTADAQAKKAEPEDGNGELRITNAYIDSTTKDTAKASGDIAIQSIRTARGVSRVDISNSTINAKGAGTQAGDVIIHASAETNLASWDIGDGAYAVVDVNNSKVTGDNVDLAANASTAGHFDGATTAMTEEEIRAGLSEDENFLSTVGDELSNLRAFMSVTKTHTEANVNVTDSDLSAVGGTKAKEVKEGETAKHGDLSVTSNAVGAIDTTTASVAVGVNVGISDVESKVNITGASKLYSAGDTTIDANGYNRVDLSLLNVNVLDFKAVGTINLSWAQMTTDVEAKIDTSANVTAKGDVDVDATSTRYLYSSAKGYSTVDKVNIAFAAAKAKTEAKALVKGSIYAGGDVSVTADNTLDKPNNVYQADTAYAISQTGSSAFTQAQFYTMGSLNLESWMGQYTESLMNSYFGIDGAGALLLSDNTAKADVSGKIRGVTAEGVGSDALGAGSLLVDAHALSRTSTRASAVSTTMPTGEGEMQKQNSASVGIIYAQQENKSEASVTGDVKTDKNTKADGTETTGDVTINAKTEIPWQTTWQDVASLNYTRWLEKLFTVMTENDFGISDLVDSWAQSEAAGSTNSVAGTFTWMNYDNTSNAYIGENAKVASAGKVDIDALNDITVVNFSGAVKNPLATSLVEQGFNAWSLNWLNHNYLDDKNVTSVSGIGGAILTVDQTNTANAYIAKGATVTAAGDVTADAKNDAMNLAIAMAGGNAKTNAVDMSLTVDLIRDTTKAYIDGTVETEGDVEASATDDSMIVNIAGGVGVSGSNAVGASFGYNQISRETEAYITGKVAAKGNVALDAKNTGELVSVAAAGAVAFTAEGTKPRSELSDVEQIAALYENHVSDAKASTHHFSASGTITGNVISDTANAYVARSKKETKDKDGNVTKTEYGAAPEIRAGALSITSNNDSYIFSGAGALSLSLPSQSTNQQALAGTFGVNYITAENNAYVDHADLVLTGNTGKKKVLDAEGNVVKNADGTDKEEEIDESLTISATNDEQIINVAASIGMAFRNSTAVAGQVGVNIVTNTDKAYVADSTVRADEAVSVSAEDRERIDNYTGAVSIAGGDDSAAVGAAFGLGIVRGRTDAYITSSEVTGTEKETDGTYTRGGTVDVTAKDTGVIRSLVGGASVSGLTGYEGKGFSFTGTINYNDLELETKAYIDTDKAMKTEKVTVDGENLSTATIISAEGSASYGMSVAGAAVAVMADKSVVKAYVAGDAEKKNTIDASGIEIKAENTYNGSASDSDSDSTAKTVAIGAGGTTYTFAGAASVTVNTVTQETKAYLGAGSYTAGEDAVDIEAKTTARLFGMAGGLAVSSGSGVGAAFDTQVYNGTTHAWIADGAKLNGAGAVTVNAESFEKMMSVAATLAASAGDDGTGSVGWNGAGAAGAHSIKTNTKAYIGNEEDREKTADTAAALSDVGNLSVTAKDETRLSTGTGSGAVSGDKAGVGLSAAVEVVDKTAMAFIGNHTTLAGTGDLTVQADNISVSTTDAAGLGAANAGVGFAGAASETIAKHTTKAYIGKGADVKAANAAVIRAASTFTQTSVAGEVSAGGKVSAGLANATVALTADTYAYADDEAKLAAGSIAIDAYHKTQIKYATVSATVSKQLAFEGVLGVNRLKETTKAYAGEKTELTADGDLSITAKDETDLDGGTGGLSIGAKNAGVGLAGTVNLVTKDTEAYAGKETKLHGKGDVTIAATNTEELFTITMQGSGGSNGGLAGAMNFTALDIVTKGYTDTGVSITQDKTAEKDGTVNVKAIHNIKEMSTSTVGAAGGKTAAVGAAIDLAYLDSQTNAYIGDANTVKAAGSVTVKADEDLADIANYAVAGAVSTVSVSGAISIYNFNSAISDEDKENLENKDSGTSFDTWLNNFVDASDTAEALSKYTYTGIDYEDLTDTLSKNQQGKEESSEDYTARIDKALTKTDTVGSITSALNTEKQKTVSTAPTTSADKGTLAKIGKNTTVEAGGAVTVDADGKIKMTNVMAQVSASGGEYAGGVGANVSVVNMDTKTQALVADAAKIDAKGALSVDAYAKHNMKDVVVGASIAIGIGAAVQGTVATWNDKSDVYAQIGNTKSISAGSVSVAAVSDAVLASDVIGTSVSMVAVNGAVSTGKTTGTVKAGIGDEAGTNSDDSTVTATDGDITITSAARTDMDVDVTAPSAGLATLMGAGYGLTSDVDAVSYVGAGEKLNAEKAGISVTAKATPHLDATVIAAGAGAAAMGAVAGTIDSFDTAAVNIGQNAKLTAKENIAIKAETAKLDGKDYTIYGHVAAAAVTALAEVQAAVIQGTIDNDTTVTVANGAALDAGGRVDIDAKHSDKGDLLNDTVGVGVAAGDGADMRYTVTSDVNLTVADNVKITSGNETDIDAENVSEKVWADGSESRLNITSSGVGLAAGKGIVNKTKFTHNTTVDIGRAEIRAAAAEEEGTSVSDKYAITIDAASSITSDDDFQLAAISGAAAAYASNETKADVTTTVNVADGAALYAGDTEGAKASTTLTGEELTKEPGAHAASIRGGSIGIGTKNSADLHAKALVDVLALAAYADAENTVTYNGKANTNFGGTAETAKGDIRIAAGRDSYGNAGDITAEALTDIFDITFIPLSFRKAPVATIDSDAALNVRGAADIKSDRDIYLQSTSGEIYAYGLGNTRSWGDEAFGKGDTYGESVTSKSASTLKMEGSAETGIHRNQTITIRGESTVHDEEITDENGNKYTKKTATWTPTIESTAGISYTISDEQSIAEKYINQLEALYEMRKNYSADEAAVAAYDAEINFLQAKMVEQGYGYYASDSTGKTVFVAYTASEMKTREIKLDAIDAQLGDIYLEGDTVSGAGTMKASGDAKVTIVNDSPYDLTVGDINVTGKRSTTTVNGKVYTTSTDGGSIIYTSTSDVLDARSDTAVRTTASKTYTDADVLKETLTGLTGNVSARGNGEASAVSIKNDFKISDHTFRKTTTVDGKDVTETSAYYVAPAIKLTGDIYAPKGSVTITSESGDITSSGSIRAASVSLTAKNGDFIQSYGTAGSGQIFNAGSDPTKLDYTNALAGKVNDESAGIVANGNIFISARYVNINSTIQSGIADYELTIPEAPTVSYTDETGVEHKGLSLAEANASEYGRNGGIFTVDNAEGNAAENLTYDAAAGCFVLSDISVSGGKVQIVGTILNTAVGAEKTGKILALDGYGDITVRNNSTAGLELRNVNTGDGIEGVIEITDLDVQTGKVKWKNVYTRKDGEIKWSSAYYENGEITSSNTYSNKKEDGTYSDVVYSPLMTNGAKEVWYYNWQTGKDSSKTTVYEYHDWDFDWWGIDTDEVPTEADVLAKGFSKKSETQGAEYDLTNGTFIGNFGTLGSEWATGDDGASISGKWLTGLYYISGEKTFTNSKTATTETKTSRHIYSLGLTKSYDITMTVKEANTKITMQGVRANQNIGIGFIGSETGGKLNISSDTGDVYIRGTVDNAGGSTVISSTTGNIIASENNFIDTKDLEINAYGNAGGAASAGTPAVTNDASDTASAPIRTNAETLKGKVGGNLYIDVLDHGVALGDIEAGKTASITAAGDITQAEGAVLKAKRAELYAVGGSITGHTEVAPGGSYATVSNALKTDLSAGNTEGEDTGLKARAEGNISIYNANGDLYLDSAISETGDVTIISQGSIYDNNFTDYDNETAVEKLARWASDAVLEDADATIRKQKDRLKAMVDGKYSRYLYIKESIDENGKYQISDAEKNYLLSLKNEDGTPKYDDAKIASYVENCEKEYASLVAAGVDTWTKAGVEAYLAGIEDSTSGDAQYYGKASVTKDDLTSDTYLTQDEKAGILVGTARSAKDLLISFTSGEIKEGVTDTKTTRKETPHAEGKNVTLISMEGAIGAKTTGQTIDLSTREKIEQLTRHELAALAAAEKSDFKIDANDIVTLSSVKSITANATGTETETGKLIMAGLGGSLYMTSDGALKKGSDLYAKDEMRVKVDGDIKDVTLGSGGETVLESAEGEIDVTLTGNGTVTARAAGNVDLDKNDGDLVISTVYAAGGDVNINVTNGSIYAAARDADDFTNIEGEQVKLKATGMIGKINEGGSTNITRPIGIKATGAEAAAEGETAKTAKITVEAGTSGYIMNTGSADELNASAAAGDLKLINKGTIAGGEVKAEAGTLTINNGKTQMSSSAASVISGGTYTGKDLSVSNIGKITGGTFYAKASGGEGGSASIVNMGGAESVIENAQVTADAKLTVANANVITGGSYTGKELSVTNVGKITGGTYTADGAASLTNAGSWEKGEEETAAPILSGKSVTIKNEGTITAGEFTATAGNLTFTDTEKAKTAGDITFTAKNATTGTEEESGNVSVTAKGEFDITAIRADRKVTLTSAHSIDFDDFSAKSAELTTTGEGTDITIGTATVTDAFTVNAKHDADLGTVNAGSASITAGNDAKVSTLKTTTGDATITATAGNAETGTIESAGKTTITAAGNVTNTSITSAGDVSITATAGTITSDLIKAVDKTVTLASGGKTTVGEVEAGALDVDAKGGAEFTKITATGDLDLDITGTFTAGTVNASGKKVDIDSTGTTEIGSLTAKSADIKTTGEGADITVTNATVEDLYRVEAKGNAEIGTTEAGTAEIDAGGDVTGTSLTTTKGGADIDAGGIVNIGTVSAAGQAVDIDSVGKTEIGSLTAGSADLKTTGEGSDIKVDTAEVAGELKVEAKHDAVLGTVKAGSADIDAGNTVSITKADVTGALTVDAVKGAAVKDTRAGSAEVNVTEGALEEGSSISAKEALSVDASGDVKNVTLGGGTTTTIDAGGSMTGVTLTGNGTLTASAAGDIGFTKADGDLTVDTVTAGAGDVTIGVTNGSIYAAARDTDDFTNIQGEQVKLTASGAVGKINRGDSTTISRPLGIKATGAAATAAEEAKAAKIDVSAGTSGYIMNTGTADTLNASAAAGDLTLINKGTIAGGEVKAEAGTLTVRNSLDRKDAEGTAVISGGTYTGKDLVLDNRGRITGGTFNAKAVNGEGGNASVSNAGGESSIIENAQVTADAELVVTNGGAISGGSYTGKDVDFTSAKSTTGAAISGETVTVKNLDGGSFSGNTAEAEKTLTVTNKGSVTSGTFTATAGNLTFTDTAEAKTKGDITFTAKSAETGAEEESGNISITALGEFDITKIDADRKVTVNSAKTVDVDTLKAGSADIKTTDDGADVKVDSAEVTGELKTEAAHDTILGTVKAGSTDLKAGNDITVTSADVEGKLKAEAAQDVILNTVKAGSTDLKAGNDITVKSADVKGDLDAEAAAGDISITNAGTISGGTVKAEAGDVNITNGKDAVISGGSYTGGDISVTNAGKVTGGTFAAKGEGGTATITNKETGEISGGAFTATDALTVINKNVISGGSFSGKTAEITNEKTMTGGAFTATAGGLTFTDTDASTTEGDITFTAKNGEDGAKGDISINASGTLDIAGADAENDITITSVKTAEVGTLKAGKDAALKTTGEGSDIKVDTADVAGELKVDAKHDADLGTVTAGSTDLKAGNDISVDSATVTDLFKANAGHDADLGDITAGSADIDAGNKASVDSLTTKTGGAAIDAKDIEVTKADVKTDLTVNATNDATVTDAKAGTAQITAGNNANVSKLETTTGNATITATKGDATTGTIISAADAAITATKGSVTSGNITSGGDTSITAGNDISVTKADVEGTITAEADRDIVIKALEAAEANLNADRDLKIGDADITGKFTGTAGQDADIDDLTAKEAEITSGRDTYLTNTDIEDALKVSAGQDIKVDLSTDVTPTIKAGTIELEAERDILVTSKAPTQKLEGVDTNAKAGAALDTTKSLPNASAKGNDYDVSKKGTATLESTKGEISAKAGGTVAADTVKTKDGEISIRGNAIGIDDLQNTGDTGVEVKIDGSKNGNDPAYYAGIHSSSKTPVEITDSRIEHLDFTGKDKIGIKDSRLSGTGSMATDKVTVELGKNLDGTAGWPIGRIFIDGMNIESTEPFGRNSGGTTINGERFPETAERVVNRALYSDNYAGRDGEEAEEDSEKKADDTITFSEVRAYEQYRALSM